MKMQFQNIEPHPFLKKYIEKMWIFESSGKIPVEDLKLVIPNGNLKLTLSLRNGINASINGKVFAYKERSISLTGIVDVPVILDVEEDVATKTLCAEINPKGAYRFFHLKLDEIKNQILPVYDILGKRGKEFEEQISNLESEEIKVAFFQQFLLQQFLLQEEDLIYEFCVDRIVSSKGKITIKELENRTGYSSRWLNMKFADKIGISPKNLSTIIRFKQYYNAVSNNNELLFMKNHFYDLYYDQSHFLKEFRRFTGLSYNGFENKANDFGKLFYK